MKTICIVPCGAKKIWDKHPELGPIKAREAYIGPFARKCQEYAELFYPGHWYILSAKYGFLAPEDIVPGAYDVSFSNPKDRPILSSELSQQAHEKALDACEVVVVLGGKNYVKMIDRVFDGKKVQAPLKDLPGIGYMMRKLSQAIQANKPI